MNCKTVTAACWVRDKRSVVVSTGKKGNSYKLPSRKLSFKNMKTLNEPRNYLGKEEAKNHKINGYNKEGTF